MTRLPFELLKLAKRPRGQETSTPDQASLRRAISTAYYALFHLLTLDAGGIFVARLDIIEMMVRTYDHGKMARVSRLFADGVLPRKLGPLKGTFDDPGRQSIVDRLKSVAGAFVTLQEARHAADYDLTKRYDRQAARQLVDLAESAFSDWDQIRKDDLARIYLACFLVFDDWNKER